MKVTIATLTYRRNDDLAELIPLLLAQIKSVSHDVNILIVDNDPGGAAVTVVKKFPERLVHYEHEKNAGIAAARNHAIDAAIAADLLVFIDDDERPSDHWLERLLSTFCSSSVSHPTVAGVAGPVVSRYSETLDPWIRAGRFFERRRYPTGAVLSAAATNNLLLDLRAIRLRGIRFRDDFGLTGGSDTLFTRELVASGATIIWCDEALVFDVVPAARMSREWVLRRAFRSANSWSRAEIALKRTRAARGCARIGLTCAGIARVVVGTTMILSGRSTNRTVLEARGARMASRGRGMTLGAWGVVYAEYARTG